jgi:hypothetical protein
MGYFRLGAGTCRPGAIGKDRAETPRFCLHYSEVPDTCRLEIGSSLSRKW